uniref:ascorbate ferrireductase (transmembrane) n=2 Tax=Rhinopithecus TaxID=542827 RepID=A0A2K6KV88_RHIBE
MASGWFYLSCLLLGSLGSMCILFTIYWMQYWRDGFAWNGSIYMFNWHPVLMVAGMVVFYGGGKTPPGHTTACPVRRSLPTAPGCWWWPSGCWCSTSFWLHLGSAQSQGS